MASAPPCAAVAWQHSLQVSTLPEIPNAVPTALAVTRRGAAAGPVPRCGGGVGGEISAVPSDMHVDGAASSWAPPHRQGGMPQREPLHPTTDRKALQTRTLAVVTIAAVRMAIMPAIFV